VGVLDVEAGGAPAGLDWVRSAAAGQRFAISSLVRQRINTGIFFLSQSGYSF